MTDFDAAEDLIAIQFLMMTTAVEQYAAFSAGAYQDGEDVVWTSSDGAYSARFSDLSLADLGLANFVDVEGVLALSA